MQEHCKTHLVPCCPGKCSREKGNRMNMLESQIKAAAWEIRDHIVEADWAAEWADEIEKIIVKRLNEAGLLLEAGK